MEYLKAVQKVGLTIFAAGLCVSCTNLPTDKPAAQEISGPDVSKFDREVWQLAYVDETVWTILNAEFGGLSEDVMQSIAEQFKLITWTQDDEVAYAAIWLDCNIPTMERRRRIIKPAMTTENRDKDGEVSYKTIPAEYEAYIDIVRNSEGCSLISPAENILSSRVESAFNDIIEDTKLVRYGDALAYVDAVNTSVANFELESGR